MEPIDEDNAWDSSSASCFSSSSSGSLIEMCSDDDNAGDAVCVIDFFSGLEIISCNHTFMNLGGLCCGFSLADWFPNPDDLVRFEFFIQHLVSEERNGNISDGSPIKLCLIPPNMHGKLIMECTCHASVKDMPADVWEARIELVLSNLSVKRCREKKANRGNPGRRRRHTRSTNSCNDRRQQSIARSSDSDDIIEIPARGSSSSIEKVPRSTCPKHHNLTIHAADKE